MNQESHQDLKTENSGVHLRNLLVLVFFIGTALLTSLFFVGGTFLYANEFEVEENKTPKARLANPRLADPVGFTFEADKKNFYFENNQFPESNNNVTFTSTPNSQSYTLAYHMTAEYVGGDTDLCNAILVTSTTTQYAGKLQTLDTTFLDPENPAWEFDFFLGEGITLSDGTECTIRISLLGWDQNKTRHLEKYRENNFVELTFKVENSLSVRGLMVLTYSSIPFTIAIYQKVSSSRILLSQSR